MNIKKSIAQIAGAGALLVLSAGMAHANVLVNPSFESPSTAPGVEYAGGGDGWTAFDNAFVINSVVEPNVFDGDQVLKVFGLGGVFQEFAVNPNDVVTGTAWALNSSGDQMSGGQVAGVNLEWFDAGGGKVADSIGSSINANTTPDIWTEIGVVGATVPAGATSVRLVLITGPFGDGGPGGAPRFDAASLEIQAIPVPAAVWLFGSGLIGLVGLARRRKA